MPEQTIAVSLINLAAALVPGVMRIVRAHQAATGALPTDEQVVAQLRDTIARSVAVDDAWLTQHPEGG